MKTSLASVGLFLLLATCIVFNSLFPGYSKAATGNVSVAPAFIRVSISSEMPEKIETVTIKNNYDHEVRLVVLPYGVDSQTGQLSASEVPDEILAKSISVSETDFVLQPAQSINLKLSIRNSDELSPGGHYAALLVKQVDSTAGNVGIQQAVGISIYVIKEDGVKRDLSLSTLAISGFTFMFPKELSLQFKNSGNVVLVPRAVVKIQAGNDIYAKGVANDTSLPISPNDDLKISTDLISLKSAWLPQRYSAVVDYRADGENNNKVAYQSFWYIPWWYLIFAVFLVLFIYKKRKILVVIAKKLKPDIKPKEKPEQKISKPIKLINDVQPKPKSKK